VVKLVKMADNPQDQTDNLFAQLRLRLLEIREANPETVEEMKSLISQLEDCVEHLIIDSITLRNLQAKTRAKTRGKQS